MGLLHHRVLLFLISWGISDCFSCWLHQFMFSPTLTFRVCVFLHSSHPPRSESTTPLMRMVLSTFSCTWWPSLCLWENVYSGPLPICLMRLFVFLLLSCMNSLYVLYIKPLPNTWFVNIFSYSIASFSLFFLLWWSFLVQCSCTYLFLLLLLVLQVSFPKSHCQGYREGDFPYGFFFLGI